MMKINILYMLAASRSGEGSLIRSYLSAIISKHVFDQQQNSCNKRTVPPLHGSLSMPWLKIFHRVKWAVFHNLLIYNSFYFFVV